MHTSSRVGRAGGLSRALGAFGVAMGALYLHYVLGVFALLNSAALTRVLNPRPERARVEWGMAWSFWPGQLGVRNLRVVGQGLEVQWELAVQRAHGDVRILPLLDRQFDASDVHAFGVSLRLRPTVEPTEVRLRQAEAFPPIAGVEDPPLRFEGPLHPPEERAWTVHLRDAKFHTVEEIWVGPHRARTRGWVEGSLHSRAGWSVRFDATAGLEETTVFIRDRPVLERGEGALRASLELPDIPHTIGPERVRALTGTVRAHSEKVSLAIIGQHAPELADQIRGAGRLELEAALSGGELLPGSRLRFGGEDGRYALHPDWRLEAARFEVSAEVEQSGETWVALSAAPLSLWSGEAVLVTSPRLGLRVDSPNAIVVPPLPDHRLSFELERTEPAPVKRFARWLDALPVTLSDGQVRLEANARLTRAGAPSGEAKVSITGARGTFAEGRFAGDLALTLELQKLLRQQGVADLSSSSLELARVDLQTAHGKLDGWHGRLTLEEATLHLGSQRLVAVLRGAATDARPLLLLTNTAPALRPLLLSKELQLQADLDLSPHRLIAPSFELNGRGLSLRGGVLRDERGFFGALLARVRGVPMGATFRGDDTAFAFAVRDVWLEEQLRETGVAEAIDAASSRGVGGAGAAP